MSSAVPVVAVRHRYRARLETVLYYRVWLALRWHQQRRRAAQHRMDTSTLLSHALLHPSARTVAEGVEN